MTNITILIIGALLSISILYLVRKGKMHGPYATWWLFVALCAIVLSIFPKIIDWVAAQVGMDMALTQKERKIRRLTQKMAILEASLEKDKDQ